ncbi:MAG: hypothetical protein FJ280_08095 [Planctomycetes bacterium]|nr:hypothetical protein [Planctomycetota bacterium]
MNATKHLLTLVCVVMVVFTADKAQADFVFGAPENLGAAINGPTHEYGPWTSPDGLSLYFARSATWTSLPELLQATRMTPHDPWRTPISLGLWDTSFYDLIQVMPGVTTADGLEVYFNHGQLGGYGSQDLWVMKRETITAAWSPPINLGPLVNSSADEIAPTISPDGLELYFSGYGTNARPGGYGNADLWATRRRTRNDPWDEPANLGPTVNTPAQDARPRLSANGLVLLFDSQRSGGYGSADLYMIKRATLADPWGPPVNLGPIVNSPAFEECGWLSADGSMLYWDCGRPGGHGGHDVWQAPITPIGDFTGDGKVDAKDLAVLVANWGTSNSVCDIGPFAWGDGIVDERDLRVLMEALVAPGPKALDVPCNVVLSWLSPSFAQTCDVYFGTSQEAVKTASRTNPQDVLVSRGQTVSVYDPPAMLEFSQTYYWRVDFVIIDPTPVIYQGPVLKFTTAAQVYPIKKIAATASSVAVGCGPERTVDGSGLDKNDGHSVDQKDMWWSAGVQPNWIQYKFDRVYHLHELWVWNFNSMLEPYMGFGARTVKIEYSSDGTAWTPLANVPEFKKAPGKAGYVADTMISFGGVPAQFVKLTIEKNWGVAAQTGLSEVRFFAIQSGGAAKP